MLLLILKLKYAITLGSVRLIIFRLLDDLHETSQGEDRIYGTVNSHKGSHLRLDGLDVLLYGLVHSLVHHGANLGACPLILPEPCV